MATIEGPLPNQSDFESAWEEFPPSLGDQLHKRLRRSKFDTKQQFLPEGCLDQLINPQALKDELFYEKDILDLEDESLVSFINAHAKKVFATAYFVLGGGGSTLVATMAYFQSLEFSDKYLPIEDLLSDETMRNAPTELPFPFNQPQPRIISRTWAPMRINHFYQHQWKFLAPVFSKDQFHHVLSVDIVLPFIWVNNTTKEGLFSKVYEVEIHPEHQQLLDTKAHDTPPHVAIKEILTTENDEEVKQQIEDDFNLEANALSDIARLEHRHIIDRIAAITIDTRHYFMFQWADGGNLREFWKEHPQPNLTPELVRQSVYQLRGLADALMALHQYKDEANYRHGDLKPENILRFKDDTFVGHLKIADMGFAKRHMQVTAARGDPMSTIYGTTRYEPPETSMSPLEARSRLYDVWSLGCIILEYIIWLLYGYNKLLEFTNDIQMETGCFYLIDRSGHRPKAKVHPTVLTWMDKVADDPECSARTAIRDLLALVRDRLLVVPLQTDRDTRSAFKSEFVSVTSVDPPDPLPIGAFRARAQAVNSSLHGILKQGETDESYLLANQNRVKVAKRFGQAARPRMETYIPEAEIEQTPSPVSHEDKDLVPSTASSSTPGENDNPVPESTHREHFGPRMVDFEYKICYSHGVATLLCDLLKHSANRIANYSFSWWPLAELEDSLMPGYTRVYSNPTHQQLGPTHTFYDDMRTPDAERLFPKLRGLDSTPSNSRSSSPCRQTVLLKGTTLAHVLSHSEGGESCSTQNQHGESSRSTMLASLSSRSEGSQKLAGRSTTITNQQDQDVRRRSQPPGQKIDLQNQPVSHPILFLTVDSTPPAAAACEVRIGPNDAATINNITAAYRNLPSTIWKRATGMKFYKFQSRLSRKGLAYHYVDLDDTEESYPFLPEDMVHYSYSPSPWEGDQENLPYRGREAFFWYQFSASCGTGTQLNCALPKRRELENGLRKFEWGLHIEQRYSILVILVPVVAVSLLTLAATLWFIRPWLEKHEDDLQNATVPVMLALQVVQFAVQVVVSLLVFRWSM